MVGLLRPEAQQRTMWSLQQLDPYISNVAYGGFDRSLSVNFHLRNQWNDIEGGVQNQMVNAHLPLYILSGGAGLQLGRDVSGPLTVFSGRLSYNYVLSGGFGLLSIGGGIGVRQISLAGDQLVTPNGVYDGTLIDHKDDDLPVKDATGVIPQFDLGIWYQWNQLQIGLGGNNLFSPQARLSSDQFIFESHRSIFLQGRYDYRYNDLIEISPHVNLITDLSQVQTQIGFQVSYNDNIFGGAAFRGYSQNSRDAVIFLAGIRISKHFALFYAYDYVLSRLKSVTENNTHEFTLNYNLNELIRTGLPPKVIYNPRF